MKILIIGSGGREHAIVWALHKTSAAPLTIFCAPGNAGIGQIARNVAITQTDHIGLARFAASEGIDLTVVGPEGPLASGLVDHFEAAGLAVVGPNQSASRLEGSKAFSKDFMARHNIPTARFGVADNPASAIELIRSGRFGAASSPVVIKADGLAAGKGVVVAGSHEEAIKAIEDLMVKEVAGPGTASRVVIEEALEGREVSILLFSDGRNYALMPPARDHKRIGENDTGPNTGGMGSITDSSVIDPGTVNRVLREIVGPTLEGARLEGFPFRGVLFLGLMLTVDGPQLLEYNVRFGDPETQAILVRLRTDLLSIFEAINKGRLDQVKVEWTPGSSACVVLANRGYPGKYETGALISGLEKASNENTQVFHAGTSKTEDGSLAATGGRVLGITTSAETLPAALSLCYEAVEKIHWEGMQYRRDIGRAAAK